MKKLLLALAAGAAFILVLLWFSETGSKDEKFAVGSWLQPGKVMPQLVSSMDTAILLAPDGSLWAWGGKHNSLQNVFAQATNTIKPIRVGSDSDWVSVSASQANTLALKSDGSLWGWGSDISGQLAQPAQNPYFTKPIRIGPETNWTQISVGEGHCLGLRSDGSLWAWGQNDHGQVGDGTKSDKFTVTRIGADNDWQTIAAGGFNSYALKSNHTVWGWGLDANFPSASKTNDTLSPQQIDPGTNWVSISVSAFALLALKSDGTLWVHGQGADEYASQYVKAGSAAKFWQIGPDKDWREVYAGWGFFFARKRDGSWWVSGGNGEGQLAFGKAEFLNYQMAAPQPLGFDFEPWAFATGFRNCVLLTKDGTLWTWGERLGSPLAVVSQGDWLEKVKQQWNAIVARFSRHSPQSGQQQPDIDLTPYKLWELPASVRRSLEIPGENQDATNAAAIK